MKTMKKAIAIGLSCVLAASVFTGCSKKSETVEEVKEIRYLNFKPEIAEVYKKISAEYEKQTGVKVIVDTAANNTYEQMFNSKMGTDEAPTIFQINGPRGYANCKDYCGDVTDTELYKHLADKSMAVTDGGRAYGIPYVVEGYGIIYNSEITDKYFALANKATTYKSMDEVNTFDKLKAVVEDMQKLKGDLGIEGVFSATSLKPGEDWRWQTHLANLPIYYEFQKNNIDLASDATKKIDFSFGKNYKNIFDLYINNSTVPSKELGNKIVDDSMAEFALGKSAMVQNGNWAWGQISGVKGNIVKPEKIKYLPIYTGAEGEENQGLCVGTENFFAINKTASKGAQKAAADFLYWLYSSKEGKSFVTNDLKFIAPFDTFEESEKPTDPLAQEILRWISKENIKTVSWNFTLFPSQNFKDEFGSMLLGYAQGSKKWDDVSNTVIKTWESESKLLG